MAMQQFIMANIFLRVVATASNRLRTDYIVTEHHWLHLVDYKLNLQFLYFDNETMTKLHVQTTDL
jgi:hypothetical protein